MKYKYIPPQTYKCPNCDAVLGWVPSMEFEVEFDRVLTEVSRLEAELAEIDKVRDSLSTDKAILHNLLDEEHRRIAEKDRQIERLKAPLKTIEVSNSGVTNTPFDLEAILRACPNLYAKWRENPFVFSTTESGFVTVVYIQVKEKPRHLKRYRRFGS